MKKYSKKDLSKNAQKVMKDTEVGECFATEDGQIFLSKNRAKLHAFSNGKMKIFDYEANGSQKDSADKSNSKDSDQKAPAKTKLSAEDAIAAIEKAETVDAVNAILGKDKRKTVLDAAAKRMTDIQSTAARAEGNSNTEEEE